MITFQAPARRSHVPRHTISADAHVIIQVSSAEGGQASIPGLGQIGTVAVDAPASFDLLDVSPGNYDVMFQPALGTPARVGTLVSKG